MNLAILHYHLNRGGVTGVIRNQIKSVLEAQLPIHKIAILHGPGQSGWNSPQDLLSDAEPNSVEIQTVEVTELGYDSPNREPAIPKDSEQLERRLGIRIVDTLAKMGLNQHNTIVQIHNHNLGKNNSFLLAIRELAEHRFRLLLQIHDFAEDLRPSNFRHMTRCFARQKIPLNEYLYPDCENIHYAFLNQRDLSFFSNSNIAAQRIHFLPNPVIPAPADPQQDAVSVKSKLGLSPQEQLVVYPVRAIRRKNVTEALLFAACNPEARLAITLPAESEHEIASYERNRKLAQQLGLPVLFEAGRSGLEFADLINAADYVFTSSVAEGFGMAFLECWLMGKQLIGRNLPEITRDFSSVGLNFSGLYQQLRIPTQWFDLRNEIEQQQALLQQVLDQFTESDSFFHSDELAIQLANELSGETIDFARLMPHTQSEIVTQIHANDNLRHSLLELNPLLSLPAQDDHLVETNAKLVRQHFSEAPFAERFAHILSSIDAVKDVKTDVKPGFPQDESILQCFVNPNRFIPVRVAQH